MSRHYLTHIDRVARTAVCSVCGPTEIHVSRPRPGNSEEVDCIQVFRNERLRQRESRRKKSTGVPRHRLSQVDPGKRTALCALCGPTRAYEVKERGRKFYRCASSVPAASPGPGDVHVVNQAARRHILSQVDEASSTAICAKCGPVRVDWKASLSLQELETKDRRARENASLVTEYKRRQDCRRCGSMAVVGPDGFGFFEMHLPKEQRIAVLIRTAGPNELAAALEKRDLYCRKCLHLVNRCFASGTPVPEFRPFPAFF